MATGLDLISGSLRLLGRLAAEEDAAADDAAVGLSALNELIESLSNERLLIYEITRNARTLTASTNPHTIGESGSPNISAARPLRIEGAGLIESGGTFEQPIRIVDRPEWQAIGDKTVESAVPEKLWYEPEFPLGKIWLYPICDAASSLILYTWAVLAATVTLAADISFPPGYKRMLRFNLARDLASEFGVSLRPEVERIANESMAAIKALNVPEVAFRCEPALLGLARGGRSGGYNILTDC